MRMHLDNMPATEPNTCRLLPATLVVQRPCSKDQYELGSHHYETQAIGTALYTGLCTAHDAAGSHEVSSNWVVGLRKLTDVQHEHRCTRTTCLQMLLG